MQCTTLFSVVSKLFDWAIFSASCHWALVIVEFSYEASRVTRRHANSASQWNFAFSCFGLYSVVLFIPWELFQNFIVMWFTSSTNQSCKCTALQKKISKYLQRIANSTCVKIISHLLNFADSPECLILLSSDT